LALFLALTAVLGTFGLSVLYEDYGCSGRARPIRIATDIWVGFAPLYLAQDQGYYGSHGVEVELLTMKGAEEMRAALAAGEVDGQTTSLDTILMQVDQGIESVAVLLLDRSKGGDGIVAAEEIRSVGSLRGRTVAFQPATPSHFFLLYHLDRGGMTIDDIDGRHMDSGDAGAAFVAGKVDAAVTWEPWLTNAAQREGGHLLASSAGRDTVIVDVLAFRPSTLRDRGDDVRAVVASWNDAVHFWRENPDQANALMAAHYGLETEEFAAMISGLRYLDTVDSAAIMGTLDAPGEILDLVASINRIYLNNGVTVAFHPLPEVVAHDYL